MIKNIFWRNIKNKSKNFMDHTSADILSIFFRIWQNSLVAMTYPIFALLSLKFRKPQM